MMTRFRGAGASASVVLFSVVLLVISSATGCSNSDGDPTGPGPSPTGNYVSANGSIQVGSQTATMMINIGGISASKAPQIALGRLHIGVNDFEDMVGVYRPESDNQVTLNSTAGMAAADPYVFIGKLVGSTITGSLSGGGVSGTVSVSLAASSLPLEAIALLGAWDYSHEVRIGTLVDGVDPCPVPPEFRTIKDSCTDRYHVEIEGNTLPATSCGDSCLPDLDLATASLEGTSLTMHIPEVGEPTSPANRLFSLNLPGCNVIWTGLVEVDVETRDATLVGLVSQCQGSGDSCDTYCTDGQLNSACSVVYELELSGCVGGCECPN